MKNSSKILTTLGFALMLFFVSTLNGSCQNGYNVPLGGGATAEFAPDAIGTYYLNYSVVGLYPWPLTVEVYWQSDTYPGWRKFQELNTATGSVLLYSGTDDNVRYRVVFWTISATALGTWTFF